MSAPTPTATTIADTWTGAKWFGPEGTWLQLAPGAAAGTYKVTIANLDGPRAFEGQAVDGGLSFTRDGATELLHATSGMATEMKWLADKKNCLTVHPDEGYCRD